MEQPTYLISSCWPGSNVLPSSCTREGLHPQAVIDRPMCGLCNVVCTTVDLGGNHGIRWGVMDKQPGTPL